MKIHKILEQLHFFSFCTFEMLLSFLNSRGFFPSPFLESQCGPVTSQLTACTVRRQIPWRTTLGKYGATPIVQIRASLRNKSEDVEDTVERRTAAY